MLLSMSFTFLLACKKESTPPGDAEIIFSYKNAAGKDSAVTTAQLGMPLKINIKTDPAKNGICVVWPGTAADNLADYGKPGVFGITMSPNYEQDGYAITYDGYYEAGTYTVDFIITRDGHDGKFKQTHLTKSLIVK